MDRPDPHPETPEGEVNRRVSFLSLAAVASALLPADLARAPMPRAQPRPERDPDAPRPAWDIPDAEVDQTAFRNTLTCQGCEIEECAHHGPQVRKRRRRAEAQAKREVAKLPREKEIVEVQIPGRLGMAKIEVER
jgi:hypothetical protein